MVWLTDVKEQERLNKNKTGWDACMQVVLYQDGKLTLEA